MKNGRFLSFLNAALIAMMVAYVPTAAKAQGEKKIAVKDLPAAVSAAFHKAYPHAKIRGASTEQENGTTYYEVESVDGKVKRDLLYTVDGTCVEIEETIAARALPDAVSKSLKREFPEGKILKAERKTEHQTLTYELAVQSGKDRWEVVFDPAGKVVEKSKRKGKEAKEGDED
jgi:uncharacterized membrane protein YkoI